MHFDLSADQSALRDAARDLLDAAASPERVRAALGTPYDERLWQQMAEQGWPGVLEMGWVEAAVLAEEVGRHVAPAPWLSSVLAGVESGIGCVSFGTGPVIDAPVADLALVVTEESVTSYDISGRRPAAEPAMDQTRSLGWLDVDGLAGTQVGDAAAATALLDRGATLYAAELLGLSDRMLEVSVAYAKVREQFGRPIGSFQAVKHRCADMLVDVEGMRSAVYYAAWAIDADAPDASLAASTAKAWASDASRRVMASALQVHGGIGFTWEHDLHLYLKRAQLDQVTFGDAAFHRERIARLLRDRLTAGTPVW